MLDLIDLVHRDEAPDLEVRELLVTEQLAEELKQPAEAIELALFADLSAEQKVLKFDALTPEQLVHRYNVSLAQAVLV
ncbi:MAG: DUF790 family protein, partial [Myxococcota bacterium]